MSEQESTTHNSFASTISEKNNWGRYDKNVLRVTVERVENDSIFVHEPDNGQNIQVCFGEANRYLTREGKGSWDYLAKIVTTGSTLNLVRTRWKDGICMPELIIYEPDYLINITTIAACFDENLKESPFVGLINKIKADEPSIATHLGNLAGKLLDDIVHQNTTSYTESFDAFFHDNALSISCCKGMREIGKEDRLKEDGEKQKRNIEELINNELPKLINSYDRSKIVLEPSFFSEILGIQGRLDFLYEGKDETIIVEQKSGKGAFVRSDTPGFDKDCPTPVLKHVIQLLLYRALFQYEFQKYTHELKDTFLLYSKYGKGLVPIHNSSSLLIRAIRMRNLLTWNELQYANGAFRYLDVIKPSTLRAEGVNDRFWTTYKEGEFNRILTPVQQATPLERAYYYRFQQFIAAEQVFSSLGNRQQEDAGFSSVWIDTLEAKKAAGNIYDNLRILNFSETKGAIRAITLVFDEKISVDMSNFRRGDIVFLYPYNKDGRPDACAQMVHRGSLVDITPDTITLQLRNRQANKTVFNVTADTRWAIEHDSTSASSNSLHRSMHSFLSTEKRRRDILLFQQEPTTNNDVALVGDYGEMNDLVLNAKRADDMFLVIGPPGTGKTSFGMLNILQEELKDPQSQILLLSYTNRAVDEICSKLTESHIDFMRIGSALSCDKAYHEYLADRRLQGLSHSMAVRERLSEVRVFCGTTVAMTSNSLLFNVKRFTLAIVDEASQILEPHLIGLLSALSGGVPAIKKFILIGDHKQLPAVVQQSVEESSVSEPILHEIGLYNCRLSLFERLLNHFKKEDNTYDPRFVYMLRKQGRMHKDIAEFPNIAFYGGMLDIVGSPILPHQDEVLPARSNTGNEILDILRTKAIAFINTPSSLQTPSDKVNKEEAELIANVVLEIYKEEAVHFSADKTIGIIVPYRNQIATIRKAICDEADRQGLSTDALLLLQSICIDTVERYQGSQRDYILYGFTVHYDYQLDFLTSTNFMENDTEIDRKLNVAMTRAKRRLLMFGNAPLLSHCSVYLKLINYLREKGAYFERL